MKRIKMNVLLSIAVLSTIFTIITKAETFRNEGKYFDVKSNCYEVVDLYCEDLVLITGLTTCNLSQSQRNVGVQSLLSAVDEVECDNAQSVFCCAQMAIDETPCLGQPPLTFRTGTGNLVTNFAKIESIYCKSSSESN